MYGFLLINKPSVITSYQVIRHIKRFYKVKIGHGGTLDPLATGLLVILIKEATKLVPFILDLEREYTGQIQLGLRTDTYDITGRVLEEKPNCELDEVQVAEITRSFVGEIEQIAPPFAALKHKGKKFFELARQGQEVPIRRRKVRIKSFDITDYSFPYVSFRATVGRGVYIRALAHDLGQRLKCGACLISLQRVRIGGLTIDEAISLPDDINELEKNIRPPDQLIQHLPEIDDFDKERIRRGLGVPNKKKLPNGTLVSLIDKRNNFLAIGQVNKQIILPKRLISQ